MPAKATRTAPRLASSRLSLCWKKRYSGAAYKNAHDARYADGGSYMLARFVRRGAAELLTDDTKLPDGSTGGRRAPKQNFNRELTQRCM